MMDETLHDRGKLNILSSHSVNFLTVSEVYLYINLEEKQRLEQQSQADFLMCYMVCQIGQNHVAEY
uniref:Uncharacterized protein n=1 Tax=Arundo donax TaxID=35708 RepID=A0A0A9CBS7_ARUDO